MAHLTTLPSRMTSRFAPSLVPTSCPTPTPLASPRPVVDVNEDALVVKLAVLLRLRVEAVPHAQEPPTNTAVSEAPVTPPRSGPSANPNSINGSAHSTEL
jgi:hypothetical protein